MARKRTNELRPGHPDYLPLTDTQRRAHADALARAHDGHGCDERASALSEAAEYYAMLGEHQMAEKLFRQALDDGGPVAGSVHGCYASFLFDQGRDTEALELINQARRLEPYDPEMSNVIGEALLSHNHYQPAARWFTAGLVNQLGSLTDIDIEDLRDDFDLAMLARGRREARQNLGLTPDHIDELAQQLQGTIKSVNTH